MKLAQRLGMVFLKPKVATWRYVQTCVLVVWWEVVEGRIRGTVHTYVRIYTVCWILKQ